MLSFNHRGTLVAALGRLRRARYGSVSTHCQKFLRSAPEGFIAADLGGELIGGGSIVSYGGRFGFMGFFIIRPDHRGRGLGRRLWLHRRDRLIARLRAPPVIGMDGVFAMQGFYAREGFVLSNRDLRFEGVGAAAPADSLVDLASVPFAERHGMREVFGCARMCYGPPPVLPQGEIFAITTFELG